MFSSPRERTCRKKNLFLFLNTTQVLKKKKKMAQVVCNQCAPEINPLDGILRDYGCPGTYSGTLKNTQIAKVNNRWHTHWSPRKPSVQAVIWVCDTSKHKNVESKILQGNSMYTWWLSFCSYFILVFLYMALQELIKNSEIVLGILCDNIHLLKSFSWLALQPSILNQMLRSPSQL